MYMKNEKGLKTFLKTIFSQIMFEMNDLGSYCPRNPVVWLMGRKVEC